LLRSRIVAKIKYITIPLLSAKDILGLRILSGTKPRKQPLHGYLSLASYPAKEHTLEKSSGLFPKGELAHISMPCWLSPTEELPSEKSP
jgi:hypothetical protein